MTARAQKLFRKVIKKKKNGQKKRIFILYFQLLDPDPERRLELGELPKYLEDRWIRYYIKFFFFYNVFKFIVFDPPWP